MNDVEKNIKLKIDIPNAKTVEQLSKDLDAIDKKITRLNSASSGSSKSDLVKSLEASKALLEDQLKEATELAAIFDKIGKGQKISADEQHRASAALRDQARSRREDLAYRERLEQFTEKAIRPEVRAQLQSDLLKAGYSMKEANMYSAKGMGPEDIENVEAENADALRSLDGMAMSAGNKMANAVIRGAQSVNRVFREMTGISLSIKDNFTDIVREIGEVLSPTSGMASYDVGTTLFTNRGARELQIRYGLSGSQAYGFAQASSLLGLDTGSLTDYMYMNERQRSVFNTYMERSSQWYSRLMSSGALDSVQALQLEFSLMKQELSMEFLNFIAQNKDTIMALLQGIFDAASGILSLIPGSGNFGSGLLGAADSIMYGSNYSRTINVKVESTNNATGVINDQSGLQAQFDQWGQNLAAQIVMAIGG